MATTSTVKLKLLIDKDTSKVLFAEAGKDFIDFLFYLLSLPVGSVVKLLNSKSMVGCLGNLYESIENLNETYMQPDQSKNSVLDPRIPICTIGLPLTLSGRGNESRKFYTCTTNSYSNSHFYVSSVSNLSCPQCSQTMSREMSYVSPMAAANTGAVVGGGFVKGVVTYMVMDNLEMMPMSTISSITMLTKFNVKSVTTLEDRVVDFGVDEGLKLLKLSLECKTVLTGVFLGNTTGQQSHKRSST